MLKEHQAGASASDLCRKHGISDATFFTWRSKYGGMDVSDARKLDWFGKKAVNLYHLTVHQEYFGYTGIGRPLSRSC